MKFTYEYRTSDNVRHDGVVVASTRDDAFALLRQRGIRPSSVEEAPGFFNKLFGKGKRWLAIFVLCALCLVLCAAVFFFRGEAKVAEQDAQSTRHEAQSTLSILDSPVRRQPLGDPAIIEKGIRTAWADVFPDEGDQFLASFAIPGIPAAKRTVPESALAAALVGGDLRAPRESLAGGRDVRPYPSSDSLESRQIRAIVAGMKAEIAALLAQGWTLKEVGTALAKRQDEEIACYNRVKTELEAASTSGMDSAALEALYEERNAALRNLGIRTIPMPE